VQRGFPYLLVTTYTKTGDEVGKLVPQLRLTTLIACHRTGALFDRDNPKRMYHVFILFYNALITISVITLWSLIHQCRQPPTIMMGFSAALPVLLVPKRDVPLWRNSHSLHHIKHCPFFNKSR
jgi:hypothetical protein